MNGNERHVIYAGNNNGPIFQHHKVVGEIVKRQFAIENLAAESHLVPVRPILQIAKLFTGVERLWKGQDE
jgi:hypothetical protein